MGNEITNRIILVKEVMNVETITITEKKQALAPWRVDHCVPGSFFFCMGKYEYNALLITTSIFVKKNRH